MIEASFDCRADLQGYDGVLHGGVVCMLLDGAMTNCLFAQGRSAVTAEMQVRFRHPVQIHRRAVVRAWIESSIGVFQVLQAEIRQDDRVMATATGKFFDTAFASQRLAKTQ
jgi:acyl-coenzyme A thioesterase PaaI-like protein